MSEKCVPDNMRPSYLALTQEHDRSPKVGFDTGRLDRLIRDQPAIANSVAEGDTRLRTSRDCCANTTLDAVTTNNHVRFVCGAISKMNDLAWRLGCRG